MAPASLLSSIRERTPSRTDFTDLLFGAKHVGIEAIMKSCQLWYLNACIECLHRILGGSLTPNSGEFGYGLVLGGA
jgi:hypothetical protein